MMNLCRKNWTQNVSKRINKGKEIERKKENSNEITKIKRRGRKGKKCSA